VAGGGKVKKLIRLQEDKITCDNCKLIIDWSVVTLEFGYGSKHDGERYDFCSDRCLKEWVGKLE